MNKIFILLVGLCLFTSCIITRTPGFYSGYKRLTAEQKNKVAIVKDNEVLQQLNDSTMYAITAKHLFSIIKKQSRCIVYFWSPHCSGNACISLPSFQNFCKKNGYIPLIVAEYFDFEQLNIQGVKYSDVLAINHWQYGTDFCNAYLRRFQKSLFMLFGAEYDAKASNLYLYYDGKMLSDKKPASLLKYPWM